MTAVFLSILHVFKRKTNGELVWRTVTNARQYKSTDLLQHNLILKTKGAPPMGSRLL